MQLIIKINKNNELGAHVFAIDDRVSPSPLTTITFCW